MRCDLQTRSLYLVVRTSEAHGLPPPRIHTALLHLTAKVFDSVAFEEAGPLQLLGVWSILAVYNCSASNELVIFVSQILGLLSASTDKKANGTLELSTDLNIAHPLVYTICFPFHVHHTWRTSVSHQDKDIVERRRLLELGHLFPGGDMMRPD